MMMEFDTIFASETAVLTTTYEDFLQFENDTRIFTNFQATKTVREWVSPLWEAKRLEFGDETCGQFFGFGVGEVQNNCYTSNDTVRMDSQLLSIESATVFPLMNMVVKDGRNAIIERYAHDLRSFEEFMNVSFSNYFGYNSLQRTFQFKKGIDRFNEFFQTIEQYNSSDCTPILLSNNCHDRNYFHWFSLVLYSLHKLRLVLRHSKNPILLVTYPLEKWQYETLMLFFPEAISHLRLVNKPTTFANLIIQSGLTSAVLDGEFLAYLYKRVKRGSTLSTKLMITRNDTVNRRLVNQRELNSIFHEFSYQVLELSTYEYHIQTQMISRAKCIVFIDGSSGLNTLYSGKGVLIGIITFNEQSDWHAITRNFGCMRTFITQGEIVPNTHSQFDLYVNPNRLRNLLEEIEEHSLGA